MRLANVIEAHEHKGALKEWYAYYFVLLASPRSSLTKQTSVES